ncbi:MAG: TraB/GumN family protein [Sedimenticola sp.]|nr:TraB/GumN family protein [Sedimenticola sp.]
MLTSVMLRQVISYLLILFSLFLLGQTQAASADVPFSKGLLFKLEQTGVPPSYLFGTIHSDEERVLDFPNEVELAFESSNTLYVEIDMDAANLLAAMTSMFLDDGRELVQVLGEPLYQQAVEAASTLGLPEVAIRHYKPWALAMMLSMPPAKSGQFMDLVLYQRAVGANKKVLGIETIREQLDLFDTLPEAEQVTFLRDTLNNLDQLPTIFQALLESYLKQDLGALLVINEQLLDEGDKQLNKKFQTLVVDDRNLRMVDRLLLPLNQGGLFIAVGALHLPGERGMLRLLEQQGYRVVRIY